MNAMIDAAKYADLVLLMIDGGFGFEMETFEFLNICQVGLDREEAGPQRALDREVALWSHSCSSRVT